MTNTQSEIVPTKKIKKIAETEKWELLGESSLVENFAIEKAFLEDTLSPEQTQIIMRLVAIKQQGYKSQDKKKGIYSETEFVSIENMVELLKSSRLTCFYCNLPVKLVYKQVRDLKQWSLERVDNDYGHNHNNVVIACLDCNVRRRTMFQERYKKTKEMYCVVKLGAIAQANAVVAEANANAVVAEAKANAVVADAKTNAVENNPP